MIACVTSSCYIRSWLAIIQNRQKPRPGNKSESLWLYRFGELPEGGIGFRTEYSAHESQPVSSGSPIRSIPGVSMTRACRRGSTHGSRQGSCWVIGDGASRLRGWRRGGHQVCCSHDPPAAPWRPATRQKQCRPVLPCDRRFMHVCLDLDPTWELLKAWDVMTCPQSTGRRALHACLSITRADG